MSLLSIAMLPMLLGGCAFGGDYPVRPATRPMMDRYIELMRQPELRAKEAEKSALLQELVQAVKVDPVRARRAVGIITDDRGIPLDGVTVVVRRREDRTRAHPEPQPTMETVVVDREFHIRMEGMANIALTFQKAGYTDGGWGFGEEAGWKAYHTEGADGWLEREGSYVVPRSDGGPGVQVVMRPARYEWVPASDSDFFHPNKKYWPSEAPPDAPVLLSSDELQMIAVPETGTYVVTNGAGKVLQLVRLRRGMTIGFSENTWPRGNVAATYRGGGTAFPISEGPYAWRLYSVAKPVYPTTARTDVKTGE